MSAKEEAFRLFDKGKRVNDPELQTLGVAHNTIKKYYLQWQHQSAKPSVEAELEIPAAIAPVEIALGKLKIAQLFTLGGVLHRVAEVTPEFVRATKLTQISYDNKATMLLAIGQATLATSTLVKAE